MNMAALGEGCIASSLLSGFVSVHIYREGGAETRLVATNMMQDIDPALNYCNTRNQVYLS